MHSIQPILIFVCISWFLYGFVISAIFMHKRERRKAAIGALMCASSCFVQNFIPPFMSWIILINLLLFFYWIREFSILYPLNTGTENFFNRILLCLNDLRQVGWR